MITAAELVTKYTSDTSDLDRGVKKSGETIRKFGSGMKSAGKAATVGLTVPLVMLGKKAFDSAREAAMGQAQLGAVLKSTGGEANVTKGHANALAGTLQDLSIYEDDAIIGAENLLLTFRNVRNEVGKNNAIFDRGTKAVLNMSAAMGKDLQSSTIMIGKALNDPIKGMTAMGRAGVQFTAGQRKQIEASVEAGKTMRAQKIILEELENQFGGVAKAQAQTPWGQSQQGANALSNALESLGLIMGPIVSTLASGAQKIAKWLQDLEPSQQKIVVIIGAILAVAGPLLIILGSIATAVAAIGLPVLAVAAAVGVFVGALVYAWRNSEEFRNVVMGAFGAIRDFALEMWPKVRDTIRAAMESIRQVIKIVTAVITTIWRNYGDIIRSVTRGVWGAVKNMISGALTVIKGIFQAVSAILRGDWSALWNAIKTILRGGLQFVRGIIGGAWAWIKGIFAAGGRAIAGAWRGLWSGLGDIVGAAMDRIRGFVGGLGDLLRGAINELIGAWNNLRIPGFTINPPGPGSFSFSGFDLPNMPLLGEGAIVRRPTLAVVGEGGTDEAIIPLGTARAARMLGGGGGGSLRFISGTLGLDPDGQVTIRGWAAEESEAEDEFQGDLDSMRRGA